MATQRNLWPVGIVLTFVLFIAGTVTLVALAGRNPDDLVSANYYEDELRFQAQLDRAERTRRLAADARVDYDPHADRITVSVPAAHTQGAIHGLIHLYRPSSSGMDREMELKLDAQGRQVLDARPLQPGLWKVRLSWTANASDFLLDETVIIGAGKS